MDDAFYMAFKNIESTGKRILIALDVSGSMNCGIQNAPFLSCRSASSAIAMVTMKTERNYGIIGFTGGGWYNTGQEINNVTELKIHDGMSLNDVERYTDGLPFGGTDCALPALWAAGKNKDFDAIMVLTDNETWAGTIQPSEAMKQYRDKVGHDVKLVVVGMASNNFTIADPKDKSSLDVVGFDTSAPNIMADFITDKF